MLMLRGNRKLLRRCLFGFPWTVDLYDDYRKNKINEYLLQEMEHSIKMETQESLDQLKFRLKVLKIDSGFNDERTESGYGMAVIAIMISILIGSLSIFGVLMVWLTQFTFGFILVSLLWSLCWRMHRSKLWGYIELMGVFLNVK